MTLPTVPSRVHSGMRFGLPWLGLAIAAFAASCSSDKTGEVATPIGGGGSAGTMDTDGAVVNCRDDPRVDAYTANMEKLGLQSVLSFKLLSSAPAPPTRGTNVLKMQISKNGAPITGDLLAHLKMPDHGHETSVQPVITLDAATSTYT